MLGSQIVEEMPRGSPEDYHAASFEDCVNKGIHSRLTLSLHGLVSRHALFITASGYLGISSSDLRQGDEGCVSGGRCVPFAIRSHDGIPSEEPKPKNRRIHLVSNVYTHGIMRGEAVVQSNKHLRIIELV